MSSRRSSSRADAPRREPWPWLLAAGPALVVVASLVTAWLAVSRNDALVAADYYKLGLTINRRLPAAPAPAREPAATIAIAADGAVLVRLEPAAESTQLRLRLLRPGEPGGMETLRLAAAGDGRWIGTLRDVAPGLRVVTLESAAWRLPVTVVDRVPAEIRIGFADAPS
jgi:hypothetical protein